MARTFVVRHKFSHTIILVLVLMGCPQSFATIDVIINTPECVVFASDSRTTESTTAIASDTYEKIVQVTRYVIAQTAGTALPGNKNFKTTIQDFQWDSHLSDTSSVFIDSVVKLFESYCEHHESLGVNYAGFLVAFGGPDSLGDLRYCEYWPATGAPEYRSDYNVRWRGSKNVITRLIFGIDPDMKERIREFVGQNVPDSLQDSLKTELDAVTAKYKIAMRVQSWSLKDAIDYAYLLVNSTILVDRMSGDEYVSGKETVNPRTGGRILLCVVTRDGVRWVLPPVYVPDR